MKKWIAILTFLVLLVPSQVFGAYTLAQAVTQVRALINETTAAFWTDTEIENWIAEGTIDITNRTHCLKRSSYIPLVTSTMEYTQFFLGNISTAAVIVYGAIYEGSDAYIGLKRVLPNQISDLTFMTPGTPKYYCHFGPKILILPLPTSSENGTNVRFWFSSESDDITAIDDQYQPAVFVYAASKAFIKEHRYVEANKLYDQYLLTVQGLVTELYYMPPDNQ